MILDLRLPLHKELYMQNKANLTFNSEFNVWNERPQLINCVQVQINNWKSSVHHLPEKGRIVHIVPKQIKKNSNNTKEYVEYIFHKDKDPYFEIEKDRTTVNRRHFIHAMIAKEISFL